MSADLAAARYDAVPRSAPESRRLVADVLGRWGFDDLVGDATLCLGELATNAILHTRRPFDVVLRRLKEGVRIEVIDSRPDELPAAVPTTGTAADITAAGTTGRGLQIVAALATRWGVNTSGQAKAVWVELGADGPRSSLPIVNVGGGGPSRRDDITVTLNSLPVRAAVASGVHVDELVRELQIGVGRASQARRPEFYDLLDCSAPARLAGRHAALQAAAGDQERFDVDVTAPLDAYAATADLNRLLNEMSAELAIPAARIADDVVAFRSWIEVEVGRQLSGEAPTVCPLPT